MSRYPKLRRCPFCGEKPVMKKIKHKSLFDKKVRATTYIIKCDNCGIVFIGNNQYKDVVDKWNGEKIQNEAVQEFQNKEATEGRNKTIRSAVDSSAHGKTDLSVNTETSRNSSLFRDKTNGRNGST